MEAVVRSGDRIPVEISINPPFERDGEILFIAFVRDISDRKRAEILQVQLYEEAKHANQMLRDFSSLVVHELRRPLAVIQAYASMLADGTMSDRPAEVQRALEELKRQAHAANVHRRAAGRGSGSICRDHRWKRRRRQPEHSERAMDADRPAIARRSSGTAGQASGGPRRRTSG